MHNNHNLHDLFEHFLTKSFVNNGCYKILFKSKLTLISRSLDESKSNSKQIFQEQIPN